jgi:putative aldouronate transport system substrate-binding protein
LYLTEDQAAMTGEMATAIENHVRQHEARFTMGQDDIDDDAQWDKYVDTLNQIGLEAYLDAHQQAYETKYE